MTALLTIWEFLKSPLGKIMMAALLAGGIYIKGRSDGEAVIEAKVAAATLKLQQKAEALSNELIIQQAIAMSASAKKAGGYVQQIHVAPDDAARMRAGSVGVCSLIRGEGCAAQRGPDAAVPGPGTRARP